VRKYESIFLAILLATLAYSKPVLAATNSLHLVTSPLPIELRAEPGKSVQAELRVQNAGAETEHIKVGTLKFRAYKDTGQPELRSV
jgi:hypothetical protein